MEIKTETTKELTTNDADARKLPDELYNKYALWKSLPRIYLKRLSPDEMMRNIGIDDEEMLEVAQIRSQIDFAEKYDIHPNTLTEWNKKIAENNPLLESKSWAQSLAKNMVFALYTHTIQKGDAQLFKLWFQVVNDWNEKSMVEHSVPQITEFITMPYQPIEIKNESTTKNSETRNQDQVDTDKQTTLGVAISHR